MTAAPRPARILFVAKGFPPVLGGVERYNWKLCEHLGRLGHQVVVLVVHQDALPEAGGSPFELSPLSGASERDARRAVARELEGRRPDVVLLSRMSRTLAGPVEEVRRRGVPLFVVAHGLRQRDAGKGRWRRRSKMRAFGIDVAARVFANSRHTAERLAQLGLPPQRIEVVHPGVEPNAMRRDEAARRRVRRAYGLEDRKVVLTVARLVRNKRVDQVIAALAAVRAKVDAVHYLVVGEGDQEAALEAQVERLGLRSRVTFAGPQTDVAAFYSAADVFVLVSGEKSAGAHAGEGFGMVYAEAGACGLPCIATREGGIPEVVRDGETGILVGSDDGEGLEAGLIGLLGDPDRARQMGEAARRFVLGNFTWTEGARRVHAALEDVLSGGLPT